MTLGKGQFGQLERTCQMIVVSKYEDISFTIYKDIG
jgi:hypothetical protein